LRVWSIAAVVAGGYRSKTAFKGVEEKDINPVRDYANSHFTLPEKINLRDSLEYPVEDERGNGGLSYYDP
jgi:hypothetical protein